MSPAEIAVRERLLAAAIDLIHEHGLAGLTQPRVAKAAGVSQSHLTYYFPTHDALLTAVLELTAADQLAGVQQALASGSSSPKKLADTMGTAFEKAENSRVLISFALAASQSAEAREIFERLTRGIRECYRRCRRPHRHCRRRQDRGAGPCAGRRPLGAQSGAWRLALAAQPGRRNGDALQASRRQETKSLTEGPCVWVSGSTISFH